MPVRGPMLSSDLNGWTLMMPGGLFRGLAAGNAQTVSEVCSTSRGGATPRVEQTVHSLPTIPRISSKHSSSRR
jgi:hypothetical protein